MEVGDAIIFTEADLEEGDTVRVYRDDNKNTWDDFTVLGFPDQAALPYNKLGASDRAKFLLRRDEASEGD